MVFLSGKKRPTYSLEDHQKIIDQVRAYQADPENGPVSDGAACASIGVSYNRFKYASNVIAAHEKKVAAGEAEPIEKEVDELPLEKPNRLTAIDEVRAAQAEETEESEELEEEEAEELQATELAGPELDGVRVYVLEGTVAAVAELLMRGFR